MRNDQDAMGPFLPAGTTVRYDGVVEGGPEFGVVVHCWMSEEIEDTMLCRFLRK